MAESAPEEKFQEPYTMSLFIANRQSLRSHNSSPILLSSHSNQLPPSPCPSPRPGLSKEGDRVQYDGLVKGFTTITIAGAFIATVQAQILGNMSSPEITIADRAINAFYIGGLVLDIMASCLAFLTARWLERLREGEKNLLEKEFSRRPGNLDEERCAFSPKRRSLSDTIFYTWLGLSLFVPMPLLILGLICLLAGIYTNVWTQHSIVVAGLVTLAGVATVPFVVADFFIGRNRREMRTELIIRLSEMQGDW
ncbi:hypothetical protein F5148DRAFT_664523 [Russula earlei]|uniref:Uncharacterized protein n=1 Tax=Russula earlei TaxID=71964 RepID=A0ACC0TU61_9AGAM|nr:hypothetical protein F5148DRAFT_664523 [Russula earlei]